MFILAATFEMPLPLKSETQNFFAKSRKALKPIMADASDWRLNDGNGWIDSKFPDSWKRLDHIVGELCRYVI